MLKRSLLWLSLVVLILGVFTGCTSQNVSNETKEKTNEQMNEEKAIQTTYPLTIQDVTGNDITIASEPTRIVSLIPSLTETLFALGADEKVIAVTKWDNYPFDVKERVEFVFEDGLNPNVEQIVNLNADLVVTGSLNDELTANISNLGIQVIKFDPQNITEIYQTIEKLGQITNSLEQANQLTANMQQIQKAVMDKVAEIPQDKKVSVWVEVSSDLWTAGKGTFIDELMTKAGGTNIVEEPGWIQYSEEKVLEKNPQVIFVTYSDYIPTAAEDVLNREGWQHIEAVKNKEVKELDSDLVTRSGPRIIEALETITKALYPDLFK